MPSSMQRMAELDGLRPDRESVPISRLYPERQDRYKLPRPFSESPKCLDAHQTHHPRPRHLHYSVAHWRFRSPRRLECWLIGNWCTDTSAASGSSGSTMDMPVFLIIRLVDEIHLTTGCGEFIIDRFIIVNETARRRNILEGLRHQ